MVPGLHSLGSLRSPRSVDPISNPSLANQIPQLPKCQQKHMATIKHKTTAHNTCCLPLTVSTQLLNKQHRQPQQPRSKHLPVGQGTLASVEGEEDGEMEVDSDSDSDSESDSESDSDSDDETEDGSTGVEEEEVDSAWGSVSDAEGDDGDDGDENDGDDDEGCVDNGDDDSDDQIVRPVRHLRNVVGSDDDGEVTARAAHPPGTMAVFDELAPADIDNPCEFQIKTL